ncbi:MAG: hypothetical protein Q9190_006152 [Brigantiaea leucoxantha]
MCIWFCETFCCFLLNFREWLFPRHRRSQDFSEGFDIEPGPSVYALPQRRPYPRQQTPVRAPPIRAAAPSPSRPRTTPRSVPLPVVYPDQEGSAASSTTTTNTRVGKPSPNRMKPLPPIRTTFDGGGRREKGTGSSGVDEFATGGSSNATFRSPSSAYVSSSNPASDSPVPPYTYGARSTTAVLSAESGRGRLIGEVSNMPFLSPVSLDCSFGKPLLFSSLFSN